VARAAVDLLGGSYGKRVVVVAGKGNNGNDGREAAERLSRRGVRVAVIDAADAPERLPPADLVIDAAYGTGFRGRYQFPKLARSDTPVLAVDIPSGVSGLTGEADDGVQPATRTVTFAAYKPGLLFDPGAGLVGDVALADIGLDTSSASAHLLDDDDLYRWLPERPRESHKWKAAAWIVAGSPGMTGAAALASRGAQRAGAGYVRLSTPGIDPVEGVDPAVPTEVVTVALAPQQWADAVLAGLDRFRALVIGPGLGRDEGHAEQVRRLVATSPVPVVVDGDGLRSLGRKPTGVGAVPGSVVLTPHDGEFAGLTGRPPGPDRLADARRLAADTGAVVLLKGSTTVVAGPDGSALLVTSGGPQLATAGTGDVLAGMIGALLAQGLDAWRAAALAAFWHGRASTLGHRRGLVASDLPDLLPRVLNRPEGRA
jgi:hydroxyethylthiazole kinase-like uncharacterized protein yjeF